MFKVEISFGFSEPEKITIETFDFDKVKILQEFIVFQERHGWVVDYEAVTIDDAT